MFDRKKPRAINKRKPPSFWYAAAVGFTVFLIWPYGYFERMLFPAVGPIEIISLRETREGVLIHVAFDKRRQCDFLGLEWYLGDPEREAWMIDVICGSIKPL